MEIRITGKSPGCYIDFTDAFDSCIEAYIYSNITVKVDGVEYELLYFDEEGIDVDGKTIYERVALDRATGTYRCCFHDPYKCGGELDVTDGMIERFNECTRWNEYIDDGLLVFNYKNLESDELQKLLLEKFGEAGNHVTLRCYNCGENSFSFYLDDEDGIPTLLKLYGNPCNSENFQALSIEEPVAVERGCIMANQLLINGRLVEG